MKAVPKLGRLSSIDFFSRKTDGIEKSKNLVDIDRINNRIEDQVYSEHIRKRSLPKSISESNNNSSRAQKILQRHRYNESQ